MTSAEFYQAPRTVNRQVRTWQQRGCRQTIWYFFLKSLYLNSFFPIYSLPAKVSLCGFCRFPLYLHGFFQLTPTVQRNAVRLIGDNKLPIGVNVCVKGFLTLYIEVSRAYPASRPMTAGIGSRILNRKNCSFYSPTVFLKIKGILEP